MEEKELEDESPGEDLKGSSWETLRSLLWEADVNYMLHSARMALQHKSCLHGRRKHLFKVPKEVAGGRIFTCTICEYTLFERETVTDK